MATKADKLAELETERTRLKTSIAAAQGGASSFSADGFSVTQWRIPDLTAELRRVEKSIQRLLRGGRGIVVDMSAGTAVDNGDPYRSGGEVLL